MNIIFFTQTRSLDVFYEIYLRLNKKIHFDKVGFYVSGEQHYKKFLFQNPNFEKEFSIVKEWNIYNLAKNRKPNFDNIYRYEKEIGDPTLWSPIVTDRRLYMGKKCKYHQDYKTDFKHTEQMSILEVAMDKINQLFNDIDPNIVLTLYTATFGDCLAHMFSKSKGIQSLDIRLSRFKNYVMAVDGVTEPPSHIINIKNNFKYENIDDSIKKEVIEFIDSINNKKELYESLISDKIKKRKSIKILNKLSKLLKKLVAQNDYQEIGVLNSFLYKKIINPINKIRILNSFKNSIVKKNELSQNDFILYPLHTEPELVLSQFARPYLNQIEVIRNISHSMPSGMLLYVKEHPLMYGRRSKKYYQKILSIPNVRLVDFNLNSSEVLEYAKMVVIIRGAIGLEAVMKKIPVVSLGKSLFELLPKEMFSMCTNLYELPDIIFDMFKNYEFKKDELVKYLCCVAIGSVKVNLISDLLGKAGRDRSNIDESYTFNSHPHLNVLSDYLYKRILENE